jgi:flagellar biosynthesis protein FlhG
MTGGPNQSVMFVGNLPAGMTFTGENRFRAGGDQASRLRSMVINLPAPGATRGTATPKDPLPEAASGDAHQRARAGAVRTCPVVAITSGKGGVGKTSTCVNLAIALAKRRVRATLVDADLGLANADVLCGLTPTTRLDSVVDFGRDDSGRYRRWRDQPRSLTQISVDAPGGFRLVPGSVGIMRMANLPATQRDHLLAGLVELERDSDVVLIDTGAGLSDGVTSFAAAADLAVVIATPEPTSIADAYAMIKCVSQLRAPARGAGREPEGAPPRLALLVNQATTPAEGQAVHARIAATCRRFLGMELPLLGVLAHDPAVSQAVKSRTPVLMAAPTSRIAKDLTTLSKSLANMLQVKVPEEPATVKRGLFGWLRSR